MGSAANFADVRVCVVDDNRNFQNLFRTLLRGMGFRRVDVFGEASTARAFVTQTPIDLAFVDLVMPGESGIDWIRGLRRSGDLANPVMPIALVSGHVDRRVLEAAVQAGVDDVLVKPLSPAALFRHAQRMLQHPAAYVRGAGGYFGPDLRGVHARHAAADGEAAAGRAPSRVDARRRGPMRTVPGLHVEIRRDSDYDNQPTFLD